MNSQQNAAPPRIKGPRETKVDFNWGRVWDAVTKGEVHQYWIAQAEADMAAFRRLLPPNDPAAAADLEFAEVAHRAQSHHFEALQTRRTDERAKLLRIWDALFEQMTRLGHTTTQLLALANGSAVLAALSYLGRDSAPPTPSIGFLLVIIFGSLGFLLTLLMAHIASKMSQKPLGLIMDLTALNISEATATDLRQTLQRIAKRFTIIGSIFGYSAAACLVAAITAGTLGLYADQAQPSSAVVSGNKPTMSPPAKMPEDTKQRKSP
jgi:hypothetical protein